MERREATGYEDYPAAASLMVNHTVCGFIAVPPVTDGFYYCSAKFRGMV